MNEEGTSMRIESFLIGNAVTSAAMAADTAYSVGDLGATELINTPGFIDEVVEFLEMQGTPDWALENLRALVDTILDRRRSSVEENIQTSHQFS